MIFKQNDNPMNNYDLELIQHINFDMAKLTKLLNEVKIFISLINVQ